MFLVRPSWVRILETQYELETVIIVGFDDYLPVFAIIKSIYVLSSSIERIYFGAEVLHTEEFCEEYRTYIVKNVVHTQLQVYQQTSLQYFLPLHLIKPKIKPNLPAHK